nr:MAG TPA: hypothetical protein [Caudoviricetes sp.]
MNRCVRKISFTLIFSYFTNLRSLKYPFFRVLCFYIYHFWGM